MKVLVAITNYGPFRFGYLDKVIRTYQRMPYDVDVVIHSDRPKRVPPGTRLAVGLPTPDPWSLPFAHKGLFAAHRDAYDLFVYTEDDILIEAPNLEAFLRVSADLPEGEVAGFLRYERDDGRTYLVDAHDPYDWVPGSACTRGGYTFARFANEHSGCYALTRDQLRAALRSGGYLVGPHATFYPMRESAATDPYTRCGLTRRVCVSHLDSFLVHHLPNTYAGVLGTELGEFRRRAECLLAGAGAQGLRGVGLGEGERNLRGIGLGEGDRSGRVPG